MRSMIDTDIERLLADDDWRDRQRPCGYRASACVRWADRLPATTVLALDHGLLTKTVGCHLPCGHHHMGMDIADVALPWGT